MSAILYKPAGAVLAQDVYARFHKYYGKAYVLHQNKTWSKEENINTPKEPKKEWCDKDSLLILFFYHTSSDYVSPFVKSWNKDWIYAFNEGTGTVVSTSWKDTKDILNLFSYEGALQFLKFANQRNNKSLLFVANGEINTPHLEGWSKEEGNYFEGYCSVSNQSVQNNQLPNRQPPPTTQKTAEGAFVYEGLILKEAGEGMRKFFGTDCLVYVDAIEDNHKGMISDRIRHCDFIFKVANIEKPNLEQIRKLKATLTMDRGISIYRWTNLNSDRKTTPVQHNFLI